MPSSCSFIPENYIHHSGYDCPAFLSTQIPTSSHFIPTLFVSLHETSVSPANGNILRSRRYLLPCSDETDQFFKVIKVIVVTHDPLTMIDDPALFIALQAVKKLIQAVSPYKFCKRTGFDFLSVKTSAALCRVAFIASGQFLFNHASAVLTPFGILAPGQFQKSVSSAPPAGYILRTQTTCQSATCNSKITFHRISFPPVIRRAILYVLGFDNTRSFLCFF